MYKSLILLCACTFLQNSYAEEYLYSPVLLSLTSSWSLPTDLNHLDTSLALGLSTMSYHDLYGLGVAPFYQESLGEVYGAQVSIVNLANNLAVGLQLGIYNRSLTSQSLGLQLGVVNRLKNANFAIQAGVSNLAEELNGFQGGFTNFADKLNGVQIGFVNHLNDIHGVQVGLVNTAKDVTGLQLGLINYAENEEGTSIGLISFVQNGTFRISTNYSSQGLPFIQTEFGGKKVYNVIRYSYDITAGKLEYFLGFGANLAIVQDQFNFYPQFFFTGPPINFNSHSTSDDEKEDGITAKFGYLFSQHFEGVFGASLIYRYDSKQNEFSFSHISKYSIDFFTGIQLDFSDTIFNLLFSK